MDAYKDLVSLKGEAGKTELYLGESTNLKVIAKYTDGSSKDVTSECTFEIRDNDSEYVSINASTLCESLADTDAPCEYLSDMLNNPVVADTLDGNRSKSGQGVLVNAVFIGKTAHLRRFYA